VVESQTGVPVLSGSLFRNAMASFPSGVTIVTAVDDKGRPWGFTASSFCSVSADPPLILVCLARGAQCAPVFLAVESFAVHVLSDEHTPLAQRFATYGADKFGGGEFLRSVRGLPVLPDAPVLLECRVTARYDGGDHVILLGAVAHIDLRDNEPVLYYQRGFRKIAAAGPLHP
jgi:flavin reductase ActVB